MKLVIVNNGYAHTVIEDIDKFNLDKTLARAEIAIAIQLAITDIERGAGEWEPTSSEA